MAVRVQTADFDCSAEIAALRLSNPKIGAVVTFLGTVRDMNDGLAVIVAQAKTRWDIIDALVVHRVGPLMPQEQIVLVAVAAAHRGEAFCACEFIIDYLKMEAPFWKKEQTPEGARWVDARVSDDDALQKWKGNQ